MYYFPYLLFFWNLFWFTHHNSINENDMNVSIKKIDLWSIHRWSYARYKGSRTFTASYNNVIKQYEFEGKRYLSYDDVVNRAFEL